MSTLRGKQYDAVTERIRYHSQDARMVLLHIEKDLTWLGQWLVPPMPWDVLAHKDALARAVLPNYQKHFHAMPESSLVVESLGWQLLQSLIDQLPAHPPRDVFHTRYFVELPQWKRSSGPDMSYTPRDTSHDEQSGIVYILHAEGTPRIKIGRTASLPVRLDTLRTASPFPLRLLREIRTSHSVYLEKMLHQRYAAYRQHREWFDLPQETLQQLLREAFPN